MTLGDKLKAAREKKNYSLREVESKLKAVGVNYTHTNVKRIEDGDSEKVSIKVLVGLCEIYGLDKRTMLNLAGAKLEETPQVDEFISQGALLFNDENMDFETKKKMLDALTQIYFEAMLKNTEKR